MAHVVKSEHIESRICKHREIKLPIHTQNYLPNIANSSIESLESNRWSKHQPQLYVIETEIIFCCYLTIGCWDEKSGKQVGEFSRHTPRHN